jgi:hypothetical protein
MTVAVALDATPGPSARITVTGITTSPVTDPYATNGGEWLSYSGYGTGGAGTFAVNQAVASGPNGTATTAAKKAWTTAPTAWANQGVDVRSTTAGAQWPVATSDGRTFSVWVYGSAATAKTFRPSIIWNNGATFVGFTVGSTVSVAPNTWTQVSIVLPSTLPYPTATQFQLVVDVVGGTSFWAAGEYFLATWAMIAPVGWAFPGTAPAASVQVYRGDGSSETRVAGDDQQIPAGGIFLTDYRLPVARTVSYRVVLYSAAGTVVATLYSSGVTSPTIDPTLAWVMDPEDPTNAMLLPLMDGTDDAVGHSSAGAAVPPLEGLPIWLGGPRNTRPRRFIVKTATVAEAGQFEQIIEPGGTLLIRPTSRIRHATGLIYMGTPDLPESPQHPFEGPGRWTIEGTEVADDGWPVVVTEWTWQDVKNTYATWADVKAAFATWLAVKAG